MLTLTKGLDWSRRAALIALAASVLGCTRDALAPRWATPEEAVARIGATTAWSPAVRIEAAWPGAHPNFNTPALDGCPASSRDGKTFFLASTRPGSRGIDIWVSHRASVDEPWGEPANVGEPINSAFNDFCPMPARDGHEFYFVSNRPGGCGGDDIYVTRFRDDGTIDPPENLGCAVNSAANEAGPVPLTEPGRGPVLYFSSTRAGGLSPEPAGAVSGDADLYSSEWRAGRWQAPTLVPGVNSAQEDGQPYVQRDALELYFFSTRPGGLGAQDIWMASREQARDAWSAPVNLGSTVNSAAAETRPSLSWDGATLYFGSTRSTGESNIYVSVRARLVGR
ncbi:hypothetical protein [Roseisolibacter agri]|uniref:WD40-like Beta Propeller Repeat protein n=1 Tax=Roseisolibacter agri TaxID=2014610 RepID=A0AA37VCK6_9BACT|nr:hypothetical protein [Roseisolibacter agri]GLC27778.1 hypothetical protein rosag_42910 [Roseisolibacter agri]